MILWLNDWLNVIIFSNFKDQNLKIVVKIQVWDFLVA